LIVIELHEYTMELTFAIGLPFAVQDWLTFTVPLLAGQAVEHV
jgi:hypothetical protein